MTRATSREYHSSREPAASGYCERGGSLKALPGSKMFCLLHLRQHFFLHYHFTFEVKLSFVPEGAVRQVVFSGGGTDGKLLRCSLIMRSSLISPGFRGFPFWIWHINFCLF
jgi:hypothetical protein